MNANRALVVLALGIFSATPALADRPAYCAAYATDFANARAKEKVLWQHKYDIALEACMPSEKSAQAGVKPAAKVLAPKVIAPLEPKAVVAEEPQAAAAEAPKIVASEESKITKKARTKKVVKNDPATPATTPSDAAPKLLAGSDDWNAYCANKYTSFNAKTGTYMSKTGVARKCVVSKG